MNEIPNTKLKIHSKWAISFSFLHCSNVLSGALISVTRYNAEQKHNITKVKINISIAIRITSGEIKIINESKRDDVMLVLINA
jgi:hypothetical protein